MKKNLLIASLLAFTLGASAGTTDHKVKANTEFISAIAADELLQQAFEERSLSGMYNRNTADVIVSAADNQAAADELRAMGFSVGTATGAGVTVKVPVSQIGKIASLGGVREIHIARPVFPLLDEARTAGQVTAVHSGTGLTMPYKGEGTVVGIIDTGFQYDHPAFIDPETNQSRIARIWEQKCDSLEEFRPAGFSYGCEFAPGKAQLASRWYDVITSSHGTHVAGIAAGGDTRSANPYYGVAQKADIVLVSTKATDATIIDAAKYIFDYAASQGKPCVINISMGSNLGPHDGTGYADRMLDALQGEGKLIVGAVGNGSSGNTHVGKTFSIRDHSLTAGVQFTYYGKTQISLVDIWGTEGKKFKTRLFIYDKTTNKEIASFDQIDATESGIKTLEYKGLPSGATDSITVSIMAESGISQYNNKPELYLYTVCKNIDKKKIFLGINIEAVSGDVHMWNDGNYSTFNTLGHPEYSGGDDSFLASELGGTGKKIISVGAYASKRSISTLGGSTSSSGYTVGDICAYSSKGPTIDGRVKPEITAPGSLIISAYNKYYAAFKASNMIYSTTCNSKTHYYGSMQGTSMSSPFVAGIMALWLQAAPSLTPERAKEILKQTAINDSFTGSVRESGSEQWGYGKVNAYDGLKECLNGGGSGIEAVPTGNLSYSVTGGKLQLQLPADARNLTIGVYDTTGRKVAGYTAATAPALEPIEIDGLPAGMAIIKVSSAASTQTLKTIVK